MFFYRGHGYLKCVILAFVVLGVLTGITARQTRVEEMRTCSRRNGVLLGNWIMNVSISHDKNLEIIDGSIQLLQEIPVDFSLDVTILKCRTSTWKECSPVLKFLQPNACLRFKAKNALWSDFIGKFSPHFSCPLKKGTYKVMNGTLDTEKIASFLSAVPRDPSKASQHILLKLHRKQGVEDLFCAEMLLNY